MKHNNSATNRLPPKLPAVPAAVQQRRRVSTNPFAAVLQDDNTDDLVINVSTAATVELTHSNNAEIVKPTRTTIATVDDEDQNKENVVDDINDDDDDDASQTSQSSNNHNNRRVRPPRPSMAILASSRKSIAFQHRRRRRSSARFLQLSNRGQNSTAGTDDDYEDDNNDVAIGNKYGGDGLPQSNSSGSSSLLEMYQTAIRMNAENKINTTNTWNLHIIDQMDTLLSLDEEEDDDDTNEGNRTMSANGTDNRTSTIRGAKSTSQTSKPRVNFTKASCTLDASVKIYSYRVDDVHLTSYKVLANLNRTQNSNTGKNKNSNQQDADIETQTDQNGNDDEDDDANGNDKRKRDKSTSGSTLETNIANINLNKLDSAYDIDPLFHKMSKTFDEGGAKGLLLANLGVSETSCHIVFDSSSEDKPDEPTASNMESQADSSEEHLRRVPEGMMDVSSLIDKLKAMLSDYTDEDDEWDISDSSTRLTSVRSLPLVPQLSALRAEHEKLVEAGCCGPDAAIALASTIGPKTPGGKVRKYHANPDQEQDADYTIHKEAIERSQRKIHFASDDDEYISSGNVLFPDDDSIAHGNSTTPANMSSMDDDYQGGYGYNDDGVDDDDDHGFDAFIANARYSDVSLTSTSRPSRENSTSNTISQQQSATQISNLIDAISSGTTILSNSDYEFFSSQPLKTGNSTNNNEWAGAAHWKGGKDRKGTSSAPASTKKKPRKKSAKTSNSKANNVSLVVIDPTMKPDLSHLLKSTGKSKNQSSTTVLSKAMIEKYTNDENVLPHDVGFQCNDGSSSSLQQLTKLFLRPNVSMIQPTVKTNPIEPSSNVVASVEPVKSVEFLLPTTSDWGGDDDDDDGPGFNFGGNDNNDDDDEFFVPDLANVRKVNKVRVGYATVAKKVDVKRLKRDLWSELELQFRKTDNSNKVNEKQSSDDEDNVDDAPITDDEGEVTESHTTRESGGNLLETPSIISFQETVRTMSQQQSQTDITLPFYFICILHLANEKGLRLEQGDSNNSSIDARDPLVQQREGNQVNLSILSDFTIHCDQPIPVTINEEN